jgi:hypothetical protein
MEPSRSIWTRSPCFAGWLGEPTEPPALAPARGPPCFKSRVIRRRLGEPVQAELFDAH